MAVPPDNECLEWQKVNEDYNEAAQNFADFKAENSHIPQSQLVDKPGYRETWEAFNEAYKELPDDGQSYDCPNYDGQSCVLKNCEHS